ncbi:MAG: hypothetical protein KKG73_11335 [Gammaproteobacteria bacterium]|nr:hypothetical protein [Gammaproteobacteria bacterium]
MKIMIKKIILIASLLAATSNIGACAQDSPTSLKSQSGEITFSTHEQSYWTKVFFSKNGISEQLFPDEKSYFDEVTDSDFSNGKIYLKINKIVRGTVYDDTGEEEYDRAYCVFIEMVSGCIVRQETGSFCGGAWGDEGNAWIWAGEEVIIDERDPRKALNESDLESLSEIGGADNVNRCTGTNGLSDG